LAIFSLNKQKSFHIPPLPLWAHEKKKKMIDHPYAAQEDETPRRASSISQRLSRVLRRPSSLAALGFERSEHGTIFGATVNTLCNVMGAGVLSLPLAVEKASVCFALILLAVGAAASVVAVYVLVVGCDVTEKDAFTEVVAYSVFPKSSFAAFQRKLRRTRSTDSSSNEDSSEDYHLQYLKFEARNRWLRKCTVTALEVVVFLFSFGALVVYARVISDSIPPVIESFLGGRGFWTARLTWLIAGGIVFFLLSCSRNMEELKWSSTVGFITIFFIVVCVIIRYFSPDSAVPADNGVTNDKICSFGTGVFRAMSTYAVAFGYHYNVPYFYKEMQDKTPRAMMKTVAISFPIITFCYGVTGVLGFLTFGDLVNSDHAGGNIVNNYSNDDTLLNIGRLGLFFHFTSVYPILAIGARRGLHRVLMTCLVSSASDNGDGAILLKNSGGAATTVARNSLIDCASTSRLDNDVGDPNETSRLAIVLEAFLIVSLSVVLAGVFSGIGLIIDIIGVLFGIFLMMTGPGIVGLCVFSERKREDSDTQYLTTRDHRQSKVFFWMSAVLAVLGVGFTVAGLVFLVGDIRDGK
jgi:amino acid permease